MDVSGLLPLFNPESDMVFFRGDIKGFTRTSDKFIRKGEYGAEEVRDMIESLISPAIDFIHGRGGKVLQFAGDGILFFLKDPQDSFDLEEMLRRRIEEFNLNKGTDISIRIDRLVERYNMHIVEGRFKKSFFFHPESAPPPEFSNLRFEDFFPKAIVDMFGEGWLGELVEIPLGFVNISGNVRVRDILPLLKEMVDLCYVKGLYLNKIEWGDKGWMVLVGAGSPVPLKNSHLVIYEFARDILNISLDMGIPVRFGFTLDRGFAGINGNEKRWEFTYFGGNVNLAARISTGIPFNLICVDSSFREKTEDTFDFEHLGDYRFKGFEDVKSVYILKGLKRRRVTVPLAGRRNEVSEILNFLKEPYSAVLIEGESGIGKTAIVETVENRVPSLKVKGIYNSVVPLQPFMHLLSDINGILSFVKPYLKFELLKRSVSMIHGKEESEHFIKELLRSVSKDLLLIVDDATYLDDYSLNLMKWLFFEGNRHLNILISGTDLSRFDFVHSPLSVYRVNRLRLKGLGTDELQEFVRNYTGLELTQRSLKLMEEITGGNPLFVLNILDFLIRKDMLRKMDGKGEIVGDISRIPFRLKEIIRLKVNDFKGPSRNFINAGSIVGEDFEVSVTGKVANLDPPGIEGLIKKGEEMRIFRDRRGDRCFFFHSIVRRTVYESMLKKQIQVLSRRLAEEYVKVGAPLYIYKAGTLLMDIDPERSVELLKEAVKGSLDREDIKTAYTSLKTILSMPLKADDVKEVLKLFNRVAEMEPGKDILLGMYEKVKTLDDLEGVGDEVLQLANSISSNLRDVEKVEELLRIYEESGLERNFLYYMTRASLFRLKGRTEDAVETYDYIKRNFEMNPDDEFSFYLSYTTFYFFEHGDLDRIDEGIERLRSLEERIEDRDKLYSYYTLMDSIHLHRSEYDEAEGYILKALALLGRGKRLVSRASLYNDLSIVYQRKADVHGEKRYMDRSERYMKKVHSILKERMVMAALPLMTTNLATTYRNRGRIRKAIRYYYEGLLYGREIEHPIEVPFTLYMFSHLLLNIGAERLAVNMVKGYEDTNIIDLYPYINTLIHLYEGGNEERFRKATEMLEELRKRRIFRPILDHYNLLLYKNYMDGRDVLFLRPELERIKGEVPVGKLLKIINLIYGDESVDDVEKGIRKAVRIRYYTHLDVLGAMEVSQYYRRMGDEEREMEYLMLGYRLGRRLRTYPLLLKVVDRILEKGYRSGYYRRVRRDIFDRYRRLNEIERLEEFMESYEELL